MMLGRRKQLIAEAVSNLFMQNRRPVYIESRVCVVKEAAMCSFEY